MPNAPRLLAGPRRRRGRLPYQIVAEALDRAAPRRGLVGPPLRRGPGCQRLLQLHVEEEIAQEGNADLRE